MGFFPDLSFKGNLVGREFPGFLLSVSMKFFTLSFLFYYWGCFLFWGYLKFFERSSLVFPLSGVGPIQLCVPSSPPRAARSRIVRVKTRDMKRGPFSVICVWQGLAGSPFFSWRVSSFFMVGELEGGGPFLWLSSSGDVDSSSTISPAKVIKYGLEILFCSEDFYLFV